MNRLQKKCFIASAGLHLLLVVILFIGSAFFSPPKEPRIQELTFIPYTPLPVGPSAEANPGSGPPPPFPPPPPPPPKKPTPTPERRKDPDPPQQNVKEVKQAKTVAESTESKKRLTAQD